MKRFEVKEDGTATYRVAENKIVDVTAALKAIFGSPDLLKKSVHFSVGHVLRNASAGKMEDLDVAFAAIKERADALAGGKWAAHREAGETGEARTSLLAQALAQVMNVSPADAAEFISNEIATAMDEAGLDAEADSDDLSAEEKTKRRKVANAVRKSIAEDVGVAKAIATLKLAAANAKLADVAKAAEGKTSKFA